MARNSLVTFEFLLSLVCSGSALSICVPNINTIVLSTTVLLAVFIVNRRFCLVISHGLRTVAWIALFALCSLVANYSNIGMSSWIQYFLTILLAYTLSIQASKDEMLSRFTDLMRMIAIFSLLCYIAFYVLRLPTDWMPIITKRNISSVRYSSLGLYNLLLGQESRNCGPFWEPSIFAGYLSMALIIILFISKRREHQLRDALLYIASIISTFSAGGYVILFIIGIMWLWNDKKYRLYILLISILTLLFFVEAGKMLLKINYNVFSKIIYFDSIGSSTTRLYSIIINMKTWSENPLLGVGLANVDQYYLKWRSVLAPSELAPAQTSTTAIFLASFGIFGAYYSLAWIRAGWNQIRMLPIQKIMFIACILFVINEAPHTYFVLSYFLMFVLLNKDSVAEVRNAKSE